MRQTHIAGDKLFVDFSGDKAFYVDAATASASAASCLSRHWGLQLHLCRGDARRRRPIFWASQARALRFFGGCRQPSSVISYAAASSCRVATNRDRTRRISTSRRTTARRWCRRGRAVRATRPRWKSAVQVAQR